MALQPGTRLGPYEIVGPLGAGGMGEVYRGRDTRLDRTVAIKVLPEHLAENADLRSRFEREARVISSLQHPNICVLHDVGSESGTGFLVMEYLEGETLSDRLKRGAIPVEQFWTIAIEIADGLDRAHRAGIVHRDLKPGNIMLTKRGTKLLDFGLAKSRGGAVASAPSGTSRSVFEATMSHTSPASPLTSAGSIVGTVQYMSPEQIEGREIDARSDIFSFGLVLYEMLTGVRAFSGKTQASVVASILALEPKPVRELKADVPAGLERLVRQCLEKDPDARLQSVHDLKLELQMLSEVPALTSEATRASDARRVWVPWLVAVTLAVIAAAAVWHPWQKAKPSHVLRISSENGANVSFPDSAVGSNLALSPDGTTLVFSGVQPNTPGRPQLYVRKLDQLEATPLAGTEGALDPFFSPDGQWIGFSTAASLMKVPVAGGSPQVLIEAPLERGASWGDDDNIIVELVNRNPLSRISANGGKAETITAFDKSAGEVTHRWPDVLPGSKEVLFTASANSDDFDDATINVQNLQTGKRKVLIRGGSYARYVPSGHILYMNRGALYAVPFDLKKLEVSGKPVLVLSDLVSNSGTGGAQYAVSRSGMLIYVRGVFSGVLSKLVAVTLDGKATPITPSAADYSGPRLSPDGKVVALGFNPSSNKTLAANVAIYDPKRDTMTHLTFVPAPTADPIWSPGGKYIAFSSYKDGNYNLYDINADGTGEMHRLAATMNPQLAGAWHPTGKYLIYTEIEPNTRADILYLPMEGDERSGYKAGTPVVFLKTPAGEAWPSFSPDGRWVAYSSDESGLNEIYVRPFPSGSGRWQVSNRGGSQPLWSPSKHQIFYVQDSNIYVADYTETGNSIQFDKPRQLPNISIKRDLHRNFDIYSDGNRLLINKLDADESVHRDKFIVVENFLDYLKQTVTPDK